MIRCLQNFPTLLPPSLLAVSFFAYPVFGLPSSVLDRHCSVALRSPDQQFGLWRAQNLSGSASSMTVQNRRSTPPRRLARSSRRHVGDFDKSYIFYLAETLLRFQTY